MRLVHQLNYSSSRLHQRIRVSNFPFSKKQRSKGSRVSVTSYLALQHRRNPQKPLQAFQYAADGRIWFSSDIAIVSGGLELLCNSVKIHNVNIELQKAAEKLTMKDLLAWIRTNLIKERPEMFMKGDSVRPGVLALVNDCDWELTGQLDTMLEEKDVVVFISTLHGG